MKFRLLNKISKSLYGLLSFSLSFVPITSFATHSSNIDLQNVSLQSNLKQNLNLNTFFNKDNIQQIFNRKIDEFEYNLFLKELNSNKNFLYNKKLIEEKEFFFVRQFNDSNLKKKLTLMVATLATLSAVALGLASASVYLAIAILDYNGFLNESAKQELLKVKHHLKSVKWLSRAIPGIQTALNDINFILN